MVPVILSSLLRQAAEHIHTHVRQDRGAEQGVMERDNSNPDYESIDEFRKKIYYCKMQMQMQYYCSCKIEENASIPSFLHPPRAKADGLGRSEPAG